MLEFPTEYFQDEEIEGFLVDRTMKTVWAAELEVLNEVAVICARHGLQWYAAYGTLLGAVRHGGFIPWDDDIDIWMMREDYRKLMEVLAEELPEGYEIRSPHAREGYPEYQVYINNSECVRIDTEHLLRYHGCPFAVGIDIFPLDIIPSDKKRCDLQRSLFSGALMLQQLAYAAKIVKDSPMSVKPEVSSKEVMPQIEKLFGVLRNEYQIQLDVQLLDGKHEEELLEALWGAAEEMSYQNGKPVGTQVAMYLDYLKYGKVYDLAAFEMVDYMSFEGFDIPVPGDYDSVLKRIYGDYSVCVRNSGAHDYPCYKGQIEELRQKLEGK